VTRFDYNLHEVGPMVTGGLIAFPFDQAKQVLRNFREFANDLPDELVVFAGLVHAPDGSGTKLAAVLACHSGTPDDGAATMNSLRSFGTPAMDMQGPIPYTAQNGILDDAFPKGARNYWKSSFMQTLSVSALDTIVDAFAQAPSPMTGLVFEHFHGAAVRPSPTDTAFAYRAEGHNLLLMSQSMDTAEDDANIQWTRDLFDAVASARASDVYVNYLDGDEPASRVAEAYGVNYPRLQQIKKKYDPANVFKLNQNIEPA
jgi:FAD/FMN-containing dehydrogenase